MFAYDLVIITHLPSFYKVKLYNQLAKHLKIYVLFLGDHSVIRHDDFVSKDFNFEATFLGHGAFEQRKVWSSCLKLMALLLKLKYKKLIVGGWEHPEFWLSVMLRPKSYNVLCLESGQESQVTGPKSWLKRIFMRRIGKLLASGKPQVELAKHLSFTQTVLVTGGVGLFDHKKIVKQAKRFQGRFLYVGRLSDEKNIELLVQAFQQRTQFQLTIVGEGPLKVNPSDNIDLKGYVTQQQLATIYHHHDVFILPSKHEPWGLVVEEALYHHLPVLVSDKVGAKELVQEHAVGKVFAANSLTTLLEAIDAISHDETFQALRANIGDSLIDDIQNKQIQAYVQVAS